MKYLILILFLIPTQAKAFSTDDIFKAVNKARGTPLVRNAQLDHAAQIKAEALVVCSCLRHDALGLTPSVVIAQSGYKHQGAGEILARGFKSPKKLVSAWMKSPTHKSVIKSGFRETGIGMAFKGKSVYVVQLFASR